MSIRNFLKSFYFSYWSLLVFMFMIMPVFMKDVYTPSEIGIILSMLGLSKPLSVFILKYANNSKSLLILFNSIFVISTLGIFFIFEYFYVLLFIALIFGTSGNFIISYFDQLKVRTYRKYLGKFRMYGSIGGLILFGILSFTGIEKDSYIYLFLTLLIIYTWSSFSILFKRKPLKILKSKKLFDFSIFNTNTHLWIGAGVLTGFFAYYHSFFLIYLHEYTSFSDQKIYFLLMVGIFFEIIAMNMAHIFLKKFKAEKLFYFAIFISALRLLTFNVFKDNYIMLILTQSLHFFTMGIFFTSFFSLLKRHYSSKLNLVLQTYNGIIDGIGRSFLLFILGYFYFENIFMMLSYLMMLMLVYFKFNSK